MDTDESRTMHRGWTAVAALFLPRTRQGRLGSLGLIMVLAAELMPMPANVFVALLAYPVLIWALVVAVRDRRRRNRHLTARRAQISGKGCAPGVKCPEVKCRVPG
jgi:hypothetical protein